MERFSVLATTGCRDSNQRLEECVHGGGGCAKVKLEVTRKSEKREKFHEKNNNIKFKVIWQLLIPWRQKNTLISGPPQPSEELALQSLEHHSC
jgi:hypothetical protein